MIRGHRKVGLSISILHSVHNPNWMRRSLMAVVFQSLKTFKLCSVSESFQPKELLQHVHVYNICTCARMYSVCMKRLRNTFRGLRKTSSHLGFNQGF